MADVLRIRGLSLVDSPRDGQRDSGNGRRGGGTRQVAGWYGWRRGGCSVIFVVQLMLMLLGSRVFGEKVTEFSFGRPILWFVSLLLLLLLQVLKRRSRISSGEKR